VKILICPFFDEWSGLILSSFPSLISSPPHPPDPFFVPVLGDMVLAV
jgi:hypothetical protein